MDHRLLIFLVLWWVYGALGTYVLGTQTGGRPFVWGLVGVLTGPVGMIAALIVPACQGRTPKTAWSRCVAIGLTFGQFVFSEAILQYVGFGSITAHTLRRLI